MYAIELEDGRKVEFDSKPTQDQIDSVISDLSKKGRSLTETLSTSKKQEPSGDKVIDALITAQKEYVGPVAQAANTAAFGIPKFIANKVNPEFAKQMFAEQSTPAGKARRFLGEATAYTTGGAAQLGAKTYAGITGKLGEKFLPRVLAGATAGAVGAGSQITDPEMQYKDFLSRQGTQAAGGALTGAAVASLAPIIRGAANLRNLSVDKEVKVSQDIRKEFYGVKDAAVKKFEGQLNDIALKNPGRKVDIGNFIDDLSNDIKVGDIDPTAKNALRRVPAIKKMLDGKSGTELTVKQVQEIINDINTKIPVNIKKNHFEILDAVNNLKASQLEAFPEMAGVRADYQKVIEPFNNVKNQFKFNKIYKAIESGFQGGEGEYAVRQLLSPETIKKMGGIKEAQRLSSASGELIRNLIIGISSGFGAGAVFRQLNKGE